MRYRSLDQLQTDADVHSTVPEKRGLSKWERLERWAELLERQGERRLRTIDGTEFGRRRERRSKRADDSPLTVAFEDPILRAEGLRGDRVGDAVAFFGLSEGHLHHIVCYCHHGTTISAETTAVRIRTAARLAEPGTVRRLAPAAVGLSLAAACGMALAVL